MSDLNVEQVKDFKRVIESGGIVVFPTDTVYGLACDPKNAVAVKRLYHLKKREVTKPAAVMFFNLGAAGTVLDWLDPATRAVAQKLLPGSVTLLLPNSAHQYPLACREHSAVLGLRVPALPTVIKEFVTLSIPILQSSANIAGSSDPRSVTEIPHAILNAADLVLDAGPCCGEPSTVIDLTTYALGRSWKIVRLGAMSELEVSRRCL